LSFTDLILLDREPAFIAAIFIPHLLKTRIPLSEEQVPKRDGQCVMIRFLPMLVEIGQRIQDCHHDNRTILVLQDCPSGARCDKALGSIQFLLDDVVFIVRIDPEIFLCFIQ
jgi:hypothetical protein